MAKRETFVETNDVQVRHLTHKVSVDSPDGIKGTVVFDVQEFSMTVSVRPSIVSNTDPQKSLIDLLEHAAFYYRMNRETLVHPGAQNTPNTEKQGDN